MLSRSRAGLAGVLVRSREGGGKGSWFAVNVLLKHQELTIDHFVTLCLTTTAYVSVFLIVKRTYEWYATGYWNWARIVLGTGTFILLLLNGSLSDFTEHRKR